MYPPISFHLDFTAKPFGCRITSALVMRSAPPRSSCRREPQPRTRAREGSGCKDTTRLYDGLLLLLSWSCVRARRCCSLEARVSSACVCASSFHMSSRINNTQLHKGIRSQEGCGFTRIPPYSEYQALRTMLRNKRSCLFTGVT